MLNIKLINEKKLIDYCEEAFDKVWYMRSHPCDNKDIEKERKKNIKRIEKTYPEIKQYDDFDYAYWSGILASTRYILSNFNEDEKDNLDT